MVKYFCDCCGKEAQSYELRHIYYNITGFCVDYSKDSIYACSKCANAFDKLAKDFEENVNKIGKTVNIAGAPPKNAIEAFTQGRINEYIESIEGLTYD